MSKPVNRTFTCTHCLKEFASKDIRRLKKERNFCSTTCFRAYEVLHPEIYCKDTKNHPCKLCGKIVRRSPSQTKNEVFCSRVCSNKYHSEVLMSRPDLMSRESGVPITCQFCGDIFYVKPNQASRRKYCNFTCSRNARIGVTVFNKNRPDISGTKNPNYRDSNNCVSARKIANKMYGKSCAICEWDVSVAVHHITKRSAGGSNDPDNLIMLCPNHHKMADMGLLSQDELRNISRRVAVQEQGLLSL